MVVGRCVLVSRRDVEARRRSRSRSPIQRRVLDAQRRKELARIENTRDEVVDPVAVLREMRAFAALFMSNDTLRRRSS